MKINILQGSATGSVVYSETFVQNTDAQGVINLVIGAGTPVSGNFSSIDWTNGPYFLKVQTDPDGGTNYTLTETKSLQWVPFAHYANKAEAVDEGNFQLMGDASQNDEEALFEVKRNDGQTVFAVYPDGVRIYVKDDVGKGSKSGFAVGGFNPAKGLTGEFLRVTPDSVRVYVADDPTKGKKGGFAVGGYNPVKGAGDEYLRVTSDSVRIYVKDKVISKGTKGGFAVGGYNPAKGLTGDYFNVSGKTEAEQILGDARVMWYPIKEAFRAGNVLIESKDSVGTNSWASGYRSKAIGDWSQALGFQAIARGDYSTAIGKNAIANKINSFAFGEDAKARNTESYAIGRGAIASGYRSFAFGSAGVDSAGTVTEVTKARGDYSFAIGQGSQALGKGSFAFGLVTGTTGSFSQALGYKSSSVGTGSTAIGYRAKANGEYSTAIGYSVTANGNYSTVIGHNANASSYYETVIGSYPVSYTPASTTSWNSNDRLFVIATGGFKCCPSFFEQSNAMTVLKNGHIGLQYVTNPTYALELANNSTVGIGQARAYAWQVYSDGRFKSNLSPLPYGLKDIMQLSPKAYIHNNSIYRQGGIEMETNGQPDIGLIAQEVYTIIPEAVVKPTDEETDLWSMSYDKLVPVLIKAMQEQQELIENQQQQINELKSLIYKLAEK